MNQLERTTGILEVARDICVVHTIWQYPLVELDPGSVVHQCLKYGYMSFFKRRLVYPNLGHSLSKFISIFIAASQNINDLIVLNKFPHVLNSIPRYEVVVINSTQNKIVAGIPSRLDKLKISIILMWHD